MRARQCGSPGLHRRFLPTAARWLPVRDTKADPGADEGGRSHQRRSRESFPDSQHSWELGFRLPRDEEVADKAVPLLGRAYFENCPGCRQEKKTEGRLQRPRFRHGCSLFRVRPGLRTASSTPSRASQPTPRFPAISRAAPTPGYRPHGSGRLMPSRSSPASPGSVLRHEATTGSRSSSERLQPPRTDSRLRLSAASGRSRIPGSVLAASRSRPGLAQPLGLLPDDSERPRFSPSSLRPGLFWPSRLSSTKIAGASPRRLLPFRGRVRHRLDGRAGDALQQPWCGPH